MNYKQISRLLFNAIWTINDKISEKHLFKFNKELTHISVADVKICMEIFEMESFPVRQFANAIFYAKAYDRMPEIYVLSKELKRIRQGLYQ